jgi:dTDP-4-amino-4,6-dideoxygalactose transaminase
LGPIEGFETTSSRSNDHIFYIITNTKEEHTELIRASTRKNIQSVFHYIPLHSSPAGKKYGRAADDDLMITDQISERILRLPIYYGMHEDEVYRVAETIINYYQTKEMATNIY